MFASSPPSMSSGAIADCDIAIVLRRRRLARHRGEAPQSGSGVPGLRAELSDRPADGKPDWLAEANLLRLIDTADGSDWFDWPGYFSAAGVTPPERIRGQAYGNYPLVLQSVLAGQGHRALLVALDRRAAGNGQLKRAHNFTARSTRGYFLARPQNAGPNPMVEAFERWVLKEFGT